MWHVSDMHQLCSTLIMHLRVSQFVGGDKSAGVSGYTWMHIACQLAWAFITPIRQIRDNVLKSVQKPSVEYIIPHHQLLLLSKAKCMQA